MLYAFTAAIAIYPSLVTWIGLQALQVEAMILCLLLLIGHGLAWDFMAESKA